MGCDLLVNLFGLPSACCVEGEGRERVKGWRRGWRDGGMEGRSKWTEGRLVGIASGWKRNGWKGTGRKTRREKQMDGGAVDGGANG